MGNMLFSLTCTIVYRGQLLRSVFVFLGVTMCETFGYIIHGLCLSTKQMKCVGVDVFLHSLGTVLDFVPFKFTKLDSIRTLF